ncbi:MAG: phosphate ABC transporter permease subunit PstC [Actinomycetota bacterium]
MAAVGIAELQGDARRRRRESRIRRAFLAAAATAIVINAAILLSLFDGVVDFFRELVEGPGLGVLWNDTGWFPRRNLFDIKTVFVGTIIISLIAMLVATPLGLGAAMYLSEYASRRARRTLKPILEILAGVPSVVMAYFVISFISPDVVQRIFGSATFYNMLGAGIGVGILISPIVASVAEDAMYAVPSTLREASFGLGARRKSTTLRTVFPAAISGIAAALILGISRAIGETLVVTLAAGATGGSAFTVDPLGPGQTMTAALASLATGSDQVKGGSAAFPSLFFLGALLFLFTLALNLVSDRFVRRVRRKY